MAIDIGASSGRHIVGEAEDGRTMRFFAAENFWEI